MAIDPEAPRQTGRYAVVMAGDTFRARYAVGRPEVVLLGRLVLVETSDGSPFRRSTARRPRALERTGGAGTYSAVGQQDTSLADRREVEIELDPESFRTPAGDGPGRPRRAILGKRTRRILDNAWEVVDFVGDILP